MGMREAVAANGDVGDRCEIYRSVQASMMGFISAGERSASVRLWLAENVRT